MVSANGSEDRNRGRIELHQLKYLIKEDRTYLWINKDYNPLPTRGQGRNINLFPIFILQLDRR
jgi:hypothetical protein